MLIFVRLIFVAAIDYENIFTTKNFQIYGSINFMFHITLIFPMQGKHPTLGTHHAKFTNYSFDVNEFMRLIVKLGQDVQGRKMVAAAHSLELSAEDTTGNSDRARHHEEL